MTSQISDSVICVRPNAKVHLRGGPVEPSPPGNRLARSVRCNDLFGFLVDRAYARSLLFDPTPSHEV